MSTTPGGMDITVQGTLPGDDPNMPEFSVDAQFAANYRWIDDVEQAVKKKAEGMHVFDHESGGTRPSGSSGRRVPVLWRNSELEATKNRTYPYVMIGLTDISPAWYRMHNGHGEELTYAVGDHFVDPSTGVLAGVYSGSHAIPYDFQFMLQTFARNTQHDRQLYTYLSLNNRFPPRSGYLTVRDSIRQLEWVQNPRPTSFLTGDNTGNKRIFTQNWIFRVTGEFFPEGLLVTPPLIQRIIAQVEQRHDPGHVPVHALQ